MTLPYPAHHTALAATAARDGRAAALLVGYGARFDGARYNYHAATLTRTRDDELLVIDHVLAGADDGVMPLDAWLRAGQCIRPNLPPLKSAMAWMISCWLFITNGP